MSVKLEAKLGRKKTYNRDQLIGKAMELFRNHGYAGASTQMLVDALKVNRYSLYAEFGNKQQLFNEVLMRYNHEVVARNFGPLEAPAAGIEEIRELIKFFASTGTASGRGCLLCNTAVEFGAEDPTGAEFVQHYFKQISNAFYNALDNSFSREELLESVTLRVEADFFTSITLGLFVMIRANASAGIIDNAATSAINHLNNLVRQN